MINILHIGAKSLVLGVISDASVAYYSGKAKPHYPMPAIPIEVEFCSAFVAVCEMNNPQYKYGLITLYPHD